MLMNARTNMVFGLLLGILMLVSATSGSAAEAAGRPNIVLIMADDVGYECFGCYGSRQYRTPSIDQMARRGVRFPDASSTSGDDSTSLRRLLDVGELDEALPTGVDPRDSLFAYLLVLDLGVFGIAFARKWRALDVLALFATWAYFGGWYAKFYTPDAALPAMLWVSV